MVVGQRAVVKQPASFSDTVSIGLRCAIEILSQTGSGTKCAKPFTLWGVIDAVHR
jgi:hypothetical protein